VVRFCGAFLWCVFVVRFRGAFCRQCILFRVFIVQFSNAFDNAFLWCVLMRF
jgi:hypothetical protein